MDNDELKDAYARYIAHSWATSKDPSVYSKQKQREKEYNAEYYKKHKDEILKKAKKAVEDTYDEGAKLLDRLSGKSDSETAYNDLKRKAKRTTKKAKKAVEDTYDEGAKLLDRLSGKSDSETAYNDLKRKAKRTTKKAKKAVTDAYDSGAKYLDKVSGKSDLEATYNDVKRKTKRGKNKISKILDDVSDSLSKSKSKKNNKKSEKTVTYRSSRNTKKYSNNSSYNSRNVPSERIDIRSGSKYYSIDRNYTKNKIGAKMLRNAQNDAMNSSIKKARDSQRGVIPKSAEIRKSRKPSKMINIASEFHTIDRNYAKTKAGSKMLRNAQDNAMNRSIKKARDSQRGSIKKSRNSKRKK